MTRELERTHDTHAMCLGVHAHNLSSLHACLADVWPHNLLRQRCEACLLPHTCTHACTHTCTHTCTHAGEWCPVGSQEEDELSLAACFAQQLVALPEPQPQQKRGSKTLRGSSSTPAIGRGFCNGVRLCPAGEGAWGPGGVLWLEEVRPLGVDERTWKSVVWGVPSPMSTTATGACVVIGTASMNCSRVFMCFSVLWLQRLLSCHRHISTCLLLFSCPDALPRCCVCASAGSYCPSAAVRRPCEKGRWCPEGSIKSQPCNITVG